MPKHDVGTREEWSAARKELLERCSSPETAFDFEFAFTEEQMATGELVKMVEEADDCLNDWAESVGTDLARGMAESPGWNVFALEDGVVYHTYSRTAPDRFLLVPYYSQLRDQVRRTRRRLPAAPP